MIGSGNAEASLAIATIRDRGFVRRPALRAATRHGPLSAQPERNAGSEPCRRAASTATTLTSRDVYALQDDGTHLFRQHLGLPRR